MGKLPKFKILHSVDAEGHDVKQSVFPAKDANRARYKFAKKHPERYFIKSFKL